MKGEFDENLGCVNYITTYLDNVVLINILIKRYNHLVLISAEQNSDVEQIVNVTNSFFESNNGFGMVNKTKILRANPLLSTKFV